MARRPLLLTINTLIVLAITAALVAHSIPAIVFAADVSPHSFMGALVFIPGAIVFGIVVFRSVFGRSKNATVVSTIFYFMAAGLMLGALATNTGECLLADGETNWRFLFVLGGICLAVALYAILCAVLSIRWYQRLNAANQGIEAGAARRSSA